MTLELNRNELAHANEIEVHSRREIGFLYESGIIFISTPLLTQDRYLCADEVEGRGRGVLPKLPFLS